MPWNNQNGGGGGWQGGGGNNGNGGGQGPWGQGPKGPQGGGQPPDLEEILRQGQDKLKQMLPGGGKGGASPMMIGLAVLVGIGLWLAQCVYTIQPDELGAELLFGKPKTELSGAGLHFHFWPLETVEIANTAVRQVNIGSSGTNRGSSLMLSGDQNIVDVKFTVFWSVANPGEYLFNIRDPEALVKQVSESAMREIVGRRPAQDIFRDDRTGISNDVKKIVEDTLNQYKAGIVISRMAILDAAPPAQVADAFEEVQRAEQDEDKFTENGKKYANNILGAARGEAAQILEDAAGYKTQVVEEAEGEAQRFILVYDQYAKAPEVTRKRLFLETMEEVLRGSNKVIMENGKGGTGVLPYLPLPAITSNNK
jgi:membrane protease subunit HflK